MSKKTKRPGKFKKGDVVTWGNGSMSHRVREVNTDHLVVVIGAQKDQPEKTMKVFLVKTPTYKDASLPRHSDMPPDVLRTSVPSEAQAILERPRRKAS